MAAMRYSWIAIVLAACGGAPKEPAAPELPNLCEKTADHLVGLMAAGTAEPAPQEAVDKITRFLIETCTKTAWSVEAQQCFLGLKELPEADRCAPLLTIEQRDAADAAIKDAFQNPPAAGAGDSGATPPPPAPPPAQPMQADGPVGPEDGEEGQEEGQEEGEMGKKDSEPMKQRKPTRRTRGGSPGVTGDPCDGGE